MNRRTPVEELVAHVEELLELMDGMDVADYPMLPVVVALIQQDLERVKS